MLRWSCTSPDERGVQVNQSAWDASADTAAANSTWSRGPISGNECRIGDLTVKEAMEYLTISRKIDKDRASKILAFCGPRILLLKSFSAGLNEQKNLDGWFTSWRC